MICNFEQYLKSKKISGNLILWIYSDKKAKAAAALIDNAIESGALKQGMKVVEVSVANMAVGVAKECLKRGFDCMIYTRASQINKLRELNAQAVDIDELELAPDESLLNVVEVAKKYAEQNGAYFLNQFENPAHTKYYFSLAEKELNGIIPDAYFDICGTGATIKGIGDYFLEKNRECKIFAEGRKGGRFINQIAVEQMPRFHIYSGYDNAHLKYAQDAKDLQEYGKAFDYDLRISEIIKLQKCIDWLIQNPQKTIFTTLGKRIA